MPKRYKLDPDSYVKFILENPRYLIYDKGIKTPIMPIETGFNLFLFHSCNCNEAYNLTMAMIIRWGILYELLSLMNLHSKKDLETRAKNSMYFITEWLDDFYLLNWWLGSAHDIEDWDYNIVNPYKDILKYCKFCFKEIKSKVPIYSLHLPGEHEKDCLRSYNKFSRKNSKKIDLIENKLNNIASEILYSQTEKKELLYSKVRLILSDAKKEFQYIANYLFKHLKKYGFYPKNNFIPYIEATKVKPSYPKNTKREYGDFAKNYSEYKDIREIFDEMEQKNLHDRLSLANLTRRYFYIKNRKQL